MFRAGMLRRRARVVLLASLGTLTLARRTCTDLLSPPDATFAVDEMAASLYSVALCDSPVDGGGSGKDRTWYEFLRLTGGDAGGVKDDKMVAHTYPANDPIEDRHYLQRQRNIGGNNDPFKSQSWNIGAVFDGHGGWQVAEMASQLLIPELCTQMDSNAGRHQAEKNKGADESLQTFISNAILRSFKSIEEKYLNEVRQSFKLGFGEVAKVGSCVCLVMHKDSHLVVASAGDCRAVLGTEVGPPLPAPDSKSAQKDAAAPATTTTTTTKLSTRLTRDHNAREELERLILQQEHPGEDDVVVCKSETACYVKGRLQLTRALGDAYLKYREFNAPPDRHRSAGRHIREPYTPPYVKATPDISHLQLDKKVAGGEKHTHDKFVIIASDGLWDFLSDQEAVEAVFECVARDQRESAARVLTERALAVAAHESGTSLEELKQLPPGRRRRARHDDTTVVVMYL